MLCVLCYDREEEKVAKALQEAGISFKREHRVLFDCWDDTFARVDFVIHINGHIVLLEVDEGQHAWYGIECDVFRMTKIFAAIAIDGNKLPVLFVRYNPHALKVDGQLKKVRTQDRLAQLVGIISNVSSGTSEGMEVVYMYYDCHSIGETMHLDIWEDVAYNGEVRACCRQPIV